MKRWHGYENIPDPSKTRSLCINTVKTFTAEWFDQVAGTGFQKGGIARNSFLILCL